MSPRSACVRAQDGQQVGRLSVPNFLVQISDGEPGSSEHNGYRVGQLTPTAVHHPTAISRR